MPTYTQHVTHQRHRPVKVDVPRLIDVAPRHKHSSVRERAASMETPGAENGGSTSPQLPSTVPAPALTASVPWPHQWGEIRQQRGPGRHQGGTRRGTGAGHRSTGGRRPGNRGVRWFWFTVTGVSCYLEVWHFPTHTACCCCCCSLILNLKSTFLVFNRTYSIHATCWVQFVRPTFIGYNS